MTPGGYETPTRTQLRVEPDGRIHITRTYRVTIPVGWSGAELPVAESLTPPQALELAEQMRALAFESLLLARRIELLRNPPVLGPDGRAVEPSGDPAEDLPADLRAELAAYQATRPPAFEARLSEMARLVVARHGPH